MNARQYEEEEPDAVPRPDPWGWLDVGATLYDNR